MKKVFTVLFLLSGVCFLHAEQMSFVTTLSSPLGTFAQLETADHTAVTSVPLVNFCNSRSAVGTVTLKGADAYLQTLSLKNGTTLGGNAGEFRIASALNVNHDATVTGGRLMANAATVSGASSAKGNVDDTLHMSGMKVKGAKTSGLTIPGQVQSSGLGDDTELEWSNIYTKDYKSDGSETGTSSYTSYLLKSKTGTVVDCSTGPEGRSKKVRDCSCGGALYAYWNVSKCAYVPEEAVEVEVECMTRYCSVEGEYGGIDYSGCRLTTNVSFSVDLYRRYAAISRVENGKVYYSWQYQKADSLSYGRGAYSYDCGWPDGLWSDHTGCMTGFALTSSGGGSQTMQCGDCTYKVGINSDSTDEEDMYNNSYCRSASRWPGW